jgi:Ni,Fe-hydrogenase III component G
MLLPVDGLKLEALSGAAPAWRAQCDAVQWRKACEVVATAGGRLGALWASDERDAGKERAGDYSVHALLVAHEGLLWLELPVAAPERGFPDLSAIFPCARRMQRAAFDLVGVGALTQDGLPADCRGWLRHGAWSADTHPLRRDLTLNERLAPGDARYAFVTVEGDGVHEIAVGPVHAGIIEPGHFRFSVVGERVLRLEQRLGYKHKGIEKRFESLSLMAAPRGRVSGDAHRRPCLGLRDGARGHGWRARERTCAAPAGAAARRERIANHLGDLGFIGNDGGLAFGLAQFSRLKEDLLRASALFGHPT